MYVCIYICVYSQTVSCLSIKSCHTFIIYTRMCIYTYTYIYTYVHFLYNLYSYSFYSKHSMTKLKSFASYFFLRNLEFLKIYYLYINMFIFMHIYLDRYTYI